MPRLVTGPGEVLDFCRYHFPKTEEVAQRRYGSAKRGVDAAGVDAFMYDVSHPRYLTERCRVCRALLTDGHDGSWREIRKPHDAPKPRWDARHVRRGRL